MWVVYSSVGNDETPQGIRINKGDVVDDTRFWLRPGRTYKAARNVDGFEFYLTLKKHSRQAAALSFILSSVDPKDTLIAAGNARNSEDPTYTLEIVNEQDKKSLDVRRQGRDMELKPQAKYSLQNGDLIRTLSDNDSWVSVEWVPVHIYNRFIKRKETEEMQRACAQLGVTFTAGYTNVLPDSSHTHFVCPKLLKEPTIPQVLAANHQLSIVNNLWVENLIRAATIQPEQKRSKLEEDFRSNWPDEMEFFPAIDGKDSNQVEKEIWKPTPARKKLFERCVFVDYSTDPNEKNLLESAGGKHCVVSLASVDTFTKGLDAFRKDNDVKRDDPVYVVTPLGGNLEDPAQGVILNEALEGTNIRGVLDNRDVMQAITKVEKLTKTGGQAATQATTQPIAGTGRAPAPSASGPAGTADISYPATNPDDVHVPAPKRQAAEAPQAEAPRPNKKPRRLADRAPIDPFADMFSDAAPTVGVATQVVGSRGETQGSSMDLDSNIGGSSMPKPGQGKSQPSMRADSKYAKVKRRVGVENSQPADIDEAAKLDREEDVSPAKKFKSFDPDIESATSQIQEKIRKQQKLREAESLQSIAEEDDDDNIVAAGQPAPTLKRKVAEVAPDSDEEAARDATQTATRKKATQVSTAEPVKKAKGKKDAPEETQRQTQQAKYLQINTGRRKIGKADAEMNDEFNKLKIKKPVAAEAHKMGWNERDVIQEELNEEAEGWEPDDKATFFQIKFVPMVRPNQPSTRPPAAVDPKYAGMPNFKAFRPKNGQTMQAKGKKPRVEIELVAHEPLGYGLKESYGKDGGNESEEEIEMPMQNTAAKAKGKGKGKATQSQPKASAKSRKTVVPESDEEEEEEEAMSSKASTPAAPPKTGRARETITLDSNSDDGDGRTFGGFNRTSTNNRRRR